MYIFKPELQVHICHMLLISFWTPIVGSAQHVFRRNTCVFQKTWSISMFIACRFGNAELGVSEV